MTHASVFSGIGGPEVAATMLGWENLFHCEINPFGRRVLDYWYPNSKSYEDITTTDFTEWRGRVNVLTGGFPCQPFSYAGKRGGAQDDRYLWPYMFRCIDQIRPDWVVAENVAGILTMVEQGEVSEVASAPALFDTFDRVRRYQLRETFTLQRICDDLEGHGYAVQPVLVPACGVGAPHRRDRVFIIGRNVAREDSAVSMDGTIADTEHGGISERGQFGGLLGESHRERPTDGLGDVDVLSDERLRGVEGWELFPMQSPVLGRDDGLPFDVDRLTISFGKWRTEALKAYGNAIVPQVMYEIFRAIQQVEQDL